MLKLFLNQKNCLRTMKRQAWDDKMKVFAQDQQHQTGFYFLLKTKDLNNFASYFFVDFFSLQNLFFL